MSCDIINLPLLLLYGITVFQETRSFQDPGIMVEQCESQTAPNPSCFAQFFVGKHGTSTLSMSSVFEWVRFSHNPIENERLSGSQVVL